MHNLTAYRPTAETPYNETLFKTLAYGSETDPEDICEGTVVTRVIHLADRVVLHCLSDALADPSTTPEAEAKDWIKDHFTPTRCHCDHDCCGHWHGWTSAQHIGGYQWIVTTRMSRNY